MKNKLLVANFKMNKTTAELEKYFSAFPKTNKKYKDTIVFCPPFTGLQTTYKKIKNRFKLGAQNLHFQNQGAFTGEVSAKMLVDCAVEYVIIGHSERRTYNHEDGQTINNKIKTALENKLKVILCIGENEEERDSKRTNNVLSRQINAAIQGIDHLEDIIIAYEPIWAIGSGSPATLKDIEKAAKAIKKIIGLDVLYGGSVNETNATEILSLQNIDGVLVGGACLDPKKFAKICGVTDKR